MNNEHRLISYYIDIVHVLLPLNLKSRTNNGNGCRSNRSSSSSSS